MAHVVTRIAGLSLLLALDAAAGCSRKTAPPPPEPARRAEDTPSATAAAPPGSAPAAPAPSTSLAVELRTITLGVYLAAPSAPAAMKSAQDAARARFPGVAVHTSPTQPGSAPKLLLTAPSIDRLHAPTEEELGYAARGLDPAQRKAAAASKGVILLALALDADPTLSRLREAQKLVLEIAQGSDGFVWDATTRQLYSPTAWASERVQSWDGDRPDTSHQITIHYYEAEAGRHRAVTLGMGMFGLPDLVVRDLPENETHAMTTLVDAVAQLLVEGATVGAGGVLPIDLTSIRHAGAHDALVRSAAHGAKLQGRVELLPAAREEGDPDNRLVELRFASYPGATDAERQAAAVVSLVGASEEQVVYHPDDDLELAAVTARVQARLPAVADAFRAGLAPGEMVEVKGPFATDDGNVEWMWVVVSGWNGDVVTGRLANEPSAVKSLQLGAKVEVKQASIADYLWKDAAGRKKEGGESAEILLRRQSHAR